MSANRTRKLPPRPSATTSTYDALTDPGNLVDLVDQDNSVTLVNPNNRVTSVNQDNTGDLDNRVTPVADQARRPGPPRTAEPRQHMKVRASLAEELRDAVSFMVDHGQPRMKLNDALDEAVAEWLHRAKQEQNGGDEFPLRPGSRSNG
jgi:hypothetical protein